MTSGQENLLAFGGIAIAAAAAWGWFSDKSKKLKEDQFNRELRTRLESDVKELQRTTAERTAELDKRQAFLLGLRTSFERSYISGRQWLARFVAEAEQASDEAVSDQLRQKKRPAIKAAEEVAASRAERREYKELAKYLEYQLRSYKEYFPFLEDYEDVILDEAVPLGSGHGRRRRSWRDRCRHTRWPWTSPFDGEWMRVRTSHPGTSMPYPANLRAPRDGEVPCIR